MINNKVKCWVCDSGKITNVNIVSNIKITHLLCNECYLLFSNTSISKNKKIKYYSSSSGNELINRYLSNEYFDTARFLNYINLIIKKKSSSNDKINHLDIGGGFGFFSKVLEKKFPKINSFNLEPDKKAVKIAKKLNKSLKIINLPFEDINLVKKIKFDLITYWGGIYRTVEPNKVFQDLKKICKKKCDFFFSLPFSFDDMRMQHFELKNSFDDYLLTNDGVKSLFGRKHMKLFLARNQFFFKEIIIQNKPFKKKIPIFFFNLKNKTTNYKLKTKECKNYFKKNISIYNNHFQKQIDKIINKQ
jgi:2-polyprenyl-3-methyl-5-hydroxy-6-metoxy-1,4-benzoquinol methylase